MPLQLAHKRQIAQFMVIARSYLNLAAPAAMIGDTLGMTKAWYMPPGTINEEMLKQTLVGAHLSSAAIRLASIEDVLWKAEESRQLYDDCRWYFSKRNSDSTRDQRGQQCSEWLHVMLRDNAAHEEPEETPTESYEKKWRERQDCIERLTFAEAYRKVKWIADDLTEHLLTEHSFVAPAIPGTA